MTEREIPLPPPGGVLVTGATGFLGGLLVRALLRAGMPAGDLRCLVREPRRAAQGGLPAAVLWAGDLAAPGDEARLAAAAAGCRLVVHLAGTLKAWNRAGYDPVNVDGTARLAAAVQRSAPAAHWLLVSSLAAAGPSTDGRGSEAPPAECRPVSAYGESKRRGELAVLATGMPCTIVRPPVVYGPGDAATRLLFRQAMAPVCAVPPRARPLSVIHAEDVVAAVLAAMVRCPRAVLPLAGPETTDTHALLRAAAAAAGRRARLLPVPLWLAAGAAWGADLVAAWRRDAGYFNRDKVREIAAVGWVADGRAAQRELGFAPRIGLAAGLAAVARAEGLVAAT